MSAAVLGVVWGWDFVVGDTGDGTGKKRVASQVLALEASASLAWRFGP